ncbi:phosphoadenylyl-sulfate reductase [Bacillus canaveralius]|uniref:Adenosine 5'-phosphosulfate reductase n=1 Tax=Bacillus canaveralius TaxID=1403243 RepID=A0A2N5GL95_9BACI|nr:MULTISPECIES: phosphoadenylyl-sulfate reductase [Bacillus]PLR82411.1 phosphoadenylyl-sulfate reductase [Bacillus canaveralius]PLR85662.1 phosphoadenylyl-sulfate reductase [Bacillus sp. V33-4]PLR95582.1 phosphoadenylyl-sulfate reductase [Bacillus canaveralius]RSK52806.1 phosphoadenylyl-sulfate reductase [Bacillus canaveralius]
MESALTYETWNEANLQQILGQLRDSMDVLKWATRQYGSSIVYACSFGAEGMVLLDLLSKVNKEAKVIFLDTDLHFKETYELADKIRNRYKDFSIEFVKPSLTIQEQADQYGDELWKRNPNLCCQLRKIEPLASELSKVDAWISGLRREQSLTRRNIQFINKDDKFKSIKICPLIHWTWNDIWEYIQLNQLPYNPLHDQHYPSIGCAPCTVSVEGPADSRAGRWATSEKTECGLHKS